MSGRDLGPIPRGIEVLVKKAAVDPEFKTVLLADRTGAAEAIKLELDPSEAALLRAVPRDQLEAIIARTSVPDEQRRAFLGKVAAVMLAAVGLSGASCSDPVSLGIRPDIAPPTKGIRPDKTEKTDGKDDPTRGIRPDRMPVTQGIGPDRPPEPKGK